ncbi:hypothetical protein [Micromonospora inyonensis]|uniref:Uncharacterized protein n=1 Tax=Micromonospora inyonensis TaxID=47866 RepID=A0A1C6SKR0_9ACTN|nr:hypothetical protein [Micromonospora inyonensis]SCL30106.1 hypothetical protein GA0074694_5597 [Micromonospora inyonensis]
MAHHGNEPGERHDGDAPDERHRRPAGVDDETVAALGKLSEALETVERARGHLYSLHQLIGHADLMLDDVVERFRAAGHDRIADRIAEELLGRNVIAGRWTFQIVEDFDDGYYALFRNLDRQARDELVQGRRHLFEAEMKEHRRTRGRPGHEARPDGTG